MSTPYPDRVAAVLDIPLHRFLGIALTDPGRPCAGITLEVGEAALNNSGVLHGGIVTALLDVACYLALLDELEADEHAVTHDLSVSLMRPVAAGRKVLLAGQVVRRGRSIVFLRAEATVDGELVASGQITKTLLDRSSATRSAVRRPARAPNGAAVTGPRVGDDDA